MRSTERLSSNYRMSTDVVDEVCTTFSQVECWSSCWLGRDNGDAAKAEDHEPPDRPAQGGDLHQGVGARPGAPGTPASREGQGGAQDRTDEDETGGGGQSRSAGSAGDGRTETAQGHLGVGRGATATEEGTRPGDDDELIISCSVLFFSHFRSEGWPHHGRTFSIYLCPLFKLDCL